MLKRWTVVAYRQYGNWYTTCPFQTREEAEKHADRYLRGEGNEHKKDITFLTIMLPE